MITKEQLQAALRPVAEPTTGLSLVELQWIRDIMIKEGRVSLTVVGFEKGSEAQAEAERDIRFRLSEAGVGRFISVSVKHRNRRGRPHSARPAIHLNRLKASGKN